MTGSASAPFAVSAWASQRAHLSNATSTPVESKSALAAATRPPATDAVIRKPLQFLGAIYVAQINKHGLPHHALEALEVEGAKLLPFGDDDERVGAFGAGIGTVAECDACEHLPGLLHPDGIIGSHRRSHVHERGDQRDRWRFAHVVGVGLEGEAEHRDGLAAQAAAQRRCDL